MWLLGSFITLPQVPSCRCQGCLWSLSPQVPLLQVSGPLLLVQLLETPLLCLVSYARWGSVIGLGLSHNLRSRGGNCFLAELFSLASWVPCLLDTAWWPPMQLDFA